MLNTLGYLLVAFALQASPRTWTDTHGRTVTAEFVRVYQGNVVLLRGSRVLKVPFSNLSRQDQQYVTQQLAAQSHRAPDRERLLLIPTVAESPLRSSRPMAEAPSPPSLADSRHTDSDSSARRWSGPGPRLSAPAPVSRRGSGVGSPRTASPPQRPRFGRLTVEEANSLIVDRLCQYTGSRDVPRQKSTRPADWPKAKKLVRVEQDNVPILDAPDLAASNLNIFGVASVGEVFALVDQKSVLALMNPLGSTPDQSGLWYKVQMLDGKQGWIFAEPQGHQGPPIARLLAAQTTESPRPSNKKPQPQQATPNLGEALLKPLSDPQVSTAQRVGRGIGMVIGGGFAALFLIGVFGLLLLTAGGGWRWWWWRERVRRIRECSLFSWLRRGRQAPSQTT
ncbi:MAG: SHD1 domain-containing protein [Thermoguttaceae bacterium]